MTQTHTLAHTIQIGGLSVFQLKSSSALISSSKWSDWSAASCPVCHRLIHLFISAAYKTCTGLTCLTPHIFCRLFFSCIFIFHVQLLVQTHNPHINSRTRQYLALCLCTHAITCVSWQVHVNVPVISCVSGDRKLAAADSTDNLIQTLSLPQGAETKGYRFLHLGQEQESGERGG